MVYHLCAYILYASIYVYISFQSQQQSSGTGCPTMSHQPIRCRLSDSSWNTRCSSSHSQSLSCDTY